MFRNYLATAVRNLLRNRLISSINLLGLALGMAAALLLFMNIVYEWQTDRFHLRKDRLYRVYNRAVVDGRLTAWNATPPPLAPVLRSDFAFVENSSRNVGAEKILRAGDKKMKVWGNFADPSFLSMFSFPLLHGDARSALDDIHSIVISEDLARRLFGDDDAVNRIIEVDGADQFKVTGVLKNIPTNSSFKFDFLIPWQYFVSKGWENSKWDNNYVSTYVLLKKGTNLKQADQQIKDVTLLRSKTEKVELFLHPLTSEHLYNRFENGKMAGGRIENLKFLFVLALILLLIACINFMNLATAKSEKRAKEVGVRKVLGAIKGNLVQQFIGESIVLAAVAAVLAILIILFVLPYYNAFANVQLVIPFSSVVFWLCISAFVLITGLLAGSYPAFYLSSFKAARVLKGVLRNGNALVTPRKVLVIVQFVLAVFLINFTIIFRKQVNYTQQRDPGFEAGNLVFHEITTDIATNYNAIKNELINTGAAVSVSRTNTPVMWSAGSLTGMEWPGKNPEENASFEYITTDGDFIRTNGLKLVQGRELNPETHPGDTGYCMINETAVKVMGLKNPVGATITSGNKRIIAGVVSDFMSVSPNQAFRPVYIEANRNGNFMNIRLRPGAAHVNSAAAIIRRYNPAFITELSFADTEQAKKFQQANNAAWLINTFAGIAIFISCLGLFGLSVYITENRTREIGIRKVLGATVAGITSLLTAQFVKLVLISVVIATPLAWLFMNFFLQSFEYRTSISLWIPAISGCIAVFIAISTVSVQAIKAAIVNPVKSLRTE